MATINACTWNPRLEELYTGATDHNILVWAVPTKSTPATDDVAELTRTATGTADADAWSDDDQGDEHLGAAAAQQREAASSGSAAIGFA